LFAAAVLTGWWREYLLLWMLPLFTVLQVLLRLRAVCEHGAVPDTSNPLTAARTTIAPAWARFFLFPHHMNYHIEHHLYPSVPHYRLRECHDLLAARGALHQAEVVPTLRDTFRRIFRSAPAQ
jgi:fatty acid desaturase